MEKVAVSVCKQKDVSTRGSCATVGGRGASRRCAELLPLTQLVGTRPGTAASRGWQGAALSPARSRVTAKGFPSPGLGV